MSERAGPPPNRARVGRSGGRTLELAAPHPLRARARVVERRRPHAQQALARDACTSPLSSMVSTTRTKRAQVPQRRCGVVRHGIPLLSRGHESRALRRPRPRGWARTGARTTRAPPGCLRCSRLSARMACASSSTTTRSGAGSTATPSTSRTGDDLAHVAHWLVAYGDEPSARRVAAREHLHEVEVERRDDDAGVRTVAGDPVAARASRTTGGLSLDVVGDGLLDARLRARPRLDGEQRRVEGHPSGRRAPARPRRARRATRRAPRPAATRTRAPRPSPPRRPSRARRASFATPRERGSSLSASARGLARPTAIGSARTYHPFRRRKGRRLS